MGWLRTQACRIQSRYHRIDSIHPFDWRSPLLHLFDTMSVNDAKREFARGHQLRDQRMSLAPLYVLLRQGSHLFLRSLFAPKLRQRAVPDVLLFFDRNLAPPLRIQQIFPLLRGILLGNDLRIIANGPVDHVDGAPVAVGIYEVRDEVLRLGRLVRGEQFGVHQHVEFTTITTSKFHLFARVSVTMRFKITSPLARKISPLINGYCFSKSSSSGFDSVTLVDVYQTSFPSFFAASISLVRSSICPHAGCP